MIHKRFILIFTLLLFLFNYNTSLAQVEAIEKQDINLKIEHANSLIWHFNYNLGNLANYQKEIEDWSQNPSRKINDVPTFFFSDYVGEKIKLDIDKTKNNLFNYDYHLDRLEKQILFFNLQCKKVENITLKNEKKFISDLFDFIKSIETISYTISEVSYDFSRACAINFKKEDVPIQLKKIQDVVSQSKNLILALRNNNQNQAQDYLTMLDQSLLTLKSSLNIMELSLLTKTGLSITELKTLSDNVYDKAFEISAWGEQFLQSSFSEKGINNLLHKAISEYNEGEGKMGCASAFNTIIKTSNDQFILFTEEPNNIFAEKIDVIEKQIDESNIIITKLNEKEETDNKSNFLNDNIITQTITKSPEITNTTSIETLQNKEPEKENNIEKFEKFDNSNINTLAGALPNNIIILMDVSVSMKKSGQLPILKKSITHILNVMRAEDKISLVAYSGKAKVLISGATIKDKKTIQKTLEDLNSSGGSDLISALDSAYAIGQQNFIPKGNNKLIIASDGVFGVTYAIIKLVENKTKDQFSLSIFQYTKDKESNNLKSLKYLAKIGKGNFKTIKNSEEALNIMMQEIKKEDVIE